MAMPGEQLRLRLDYRPDLFDRGERGGAGGAVRAAAGGGGCASGSCARQRGHSGAEERATILRGGTRPAHALPAATLPELFAAQVARSPDAIAVMFEEERLSYGELDRRANRLAHHLRALGVGPETVVGLCLARSLELIVGLLGILKAGGAYLPLDPDYPPARLAFMLGDAGARGAGHAGCAAGAPAGGNGRACARSSCGSMPMRAAIAAAPQAPPPSRSTRSTPPMSSTPQAPPGRRKGLALRMPAFRILQPPRSSGSQSMGSRASCNLPR